jgi:iron complex outermembrane receptor protein
LRAILPALAGSLFVYSAVYGQSTAGQQAEVVVTARHAVRATAGLAVQVQAPKDQSIVTQTFIKHQVGSSNFAQLINLLPGISYSTEDPTGVLSSDLRVHGFDGAHVSVTVDGTPVNDTGNYAVYPGEYLTAEVMDHITVNIGQSEVDSPTASSIGGAINIVSKLPPLTPGFIGSVSGGSYGYYRVYAEGDTGEVGPFGTRGYLGVNYTNVDKYKGEGDIERFGLDGRIYQPLHGDDFVSAAFTYASNRPYFYESSSKAQFAQFGQNMDFNTRWAVPTATPGVADGVVPSSASAPGFEQGNDSFFWKLHPNPVDFGDIRFQSRFDLTHNLQLTVDPYFFYTLANGGGTTSLKESDPRLVGSGVSHACAAGGSGVDLNHDGDCLDTVLTYAPSNTQTHRYGLNSSLLYTFNPENYFQLSYTLDYGRHRQTGDYTPINQMTGSPANVFGGLAGFGPQILSEDGTPLRSRDRFSIAELNQVSFNYIGKYLDDKLHLNLGLRAPFFERDLNQYCYTYNGGSQYCDSVNPTLVTAALSNGIATHSTTALNTLLFGPGSTSISLNPTTNAPNFRLPFKQTFNFSKPLPNVGVSYNLNDANQFYLTFAQGFSAPKTDDLYTSSQQLVQPETVYNYGGGYRYQTSKITLSANLWASTWQNHIVQSFDPLDPTLSIDRNVGSVQLYGLDAEAGWTPIDHLTFYASAALMKSQLQSDYDVTVSSGPDKGKSIPLPAKGKELVMTPDEQFAVRAEYTIHNLTVGVQAKYTGRRFSSDVNDDTLPAFTVVDFDAEYRIPGLGKDTELQFNATNIFGTNYLDRVSTVSNAHAVSLRPLNGAPGTDVVNASSGPFFYTGAPPTVYLTLKTAF